MQYKGRGGGPAHKVVIILTQIRYSLAAPRGTVTLCAEPSASATAPYLTHERGSCRRGSIASRMRKFPEVKVEIYRADRTRLAA